MEIFYIWPYSLQKSVFFVSLPETPWRSWLLIETRVFPR
nr:MAG TPA: hypothetical protein [Caudoviricetes sp.]